MKRLERGPLRGMSVIAFSAGARSGFGVIFAWFVNVALNDAQATDFFQALFLQGGLIALLSSAAYARGAHLASADANLPASFGSFMRFVLAGALAAFVVGSMFLPMQGALPGERVGVVGLMVCGATGAATGGLLQGMTVVPRGPSTAFMPTLVANALAGVAVAASWGSQPVLLVALLWVVPQMLVPIALVLMHRDLLGLFKTVEGSGNREDQFATIGLVNVAGVGAAFTFRERWTTHVSASQASATFMVVRVTELGYQLLYMLAASVPRRVDRLMGRMTPANSGIPLVAAGVGLSLVGLLPTLAWSAWSWERLVVAEICVAPIRVLSMICLLWLLGHRTTRGYQLAMSAALLTSVLLLAIPSVQHSGFGLQAFQAVGGLPVVAITALVLRRGGKGRDSRAV